MWQIHLQEWGMEGGIALKVTVVNDVSNVFEDILPYLRESFDITLIKHTRGFWDKTFSLANKIRSSKSDIYHVNFAFSDAWLTQKLKHLDILHTHGSDVRWTQKSMKWKWMVQSNLRHANKVLYSTQDMYQHILQLRDDATFMPNPVNTIKFTNQPRTTDTEAVKAVYFKKWYEPLPTVIKKALEVNKIKLDIITKKIPYEKMPALLNNYDIFVDRFAITSHSKTALEAMSCEKCIIDWSNVLDINQITQELACRKIREAQGRKNREFILYNHDSKKVADKISNIWNDLA